MAGGSVTTLAQIVIKRVSALLIRFILFYFFFTKWNKNFFQTLQ